MNTPIVFSLLFIAFFTTSQLFAQHRVQGTVTDSSGQAMAGAHLQFADLNKGTFTNSEGEFSFTDVPGGKYTLQVTYLGFRSQKKTISVLPTGSNVISIQLTPEPQSTETALITAVRAAETDPVSQVTRSKDEIEAVYTGQDGAFLLERLSPSIVSYSESGTNLSNYGQMRLRGIDQTRINITLNGVPLNDMIDQGVFFSNFSDFGNSLESVQIQRGVGTSTNGVSSYAGSVNFESLNLEDSDPRAEVQLTGGSFNTQRASAEVQTGRLKNNTAFYTRFTKTNSDGYRYNSGTSSYSFFLSGAWFHKKHTLKFTGFLGRSKNQLAYLPVALSDIQDDPKTNYVSPNDEDDFGQWMTQLQHQYSINDKIQWSNTLYYAGAGGHFPAGFPDEDGNFTQIDYPLYNDHFGAMSNLSGRSSNYNFRWNVGVHAYTFLRTNEEAVVPNYTEPYYRDQSQKDEIAAFAKLEQKWNRWRIFADAQLRSVRLGLEADEDFLGMPTSIPQRDWLFFNPKVGISYRLAKATQLYASLGRTGREPTRFDILGSTQINDSNLELVKDQESVKAEYVNDLELGYRYRSSRLQYQINAFYMQFENEIAPIGAFIPEGFVQIYENQEQSRRYGVELDFLWNISSQWKWRGNATWMQAEISQYTDASTDRTFENVTPILSPEWNVQNTLSFHPRDNISVGATVRYLGEQFMELTNDENLIVPSSWVSDFFVEYQFTSFLRANIQVNNIFDELYYTYGAPVTGAQGMTEPGYFVQPPRHVYATLHFIF